MAIRQAYIYIIHFDELLSEQAWHYAGCTHELHSRLLRHANGHGSALTRHLFEQGKGWRLGSVQVCSHAAMRRVERHLKDQHQASRYCEICTNGNAKRLHDAQQYPIEILPFPSTSQALRRGHELEFPFGASSVSVRLTTADEPPTTSQFIRMVMDQDKDALGFIPAGGPEGVNKQVIRGLTAIVSNNGQEVGYALFSHATGTAQIINIHQCAIMDDARLCGHGRALVRYLQHLFPHAAFGCKVRDDLAANHFWEALGFQRQREAIHATSGSKILVYKIPAIAKSITTF